ncbi:hypothetical protein AX17_000335 [Amanita inopinata Kibby_2008]|nr:hypothetical protein AX17_000335 [Amanita inopinata Kibby_2008]
MMAQQRALHPATIITTASNNNNATTTTTTISTSYSLALLSEYAHTLDSLPLDLSHNFADLRELDAVLSSSMASITSKIYALTDMIERGNTPKEERLWLLTEIAEEASRLKLGGEDKIRVASQAADNLKSHSNHLRTLVELLPNFNPTSLSRKTSYPHVAPRSFMPANSFESGRRRRAGAGSLLVASATDPSPAKRKRVARDDDLDAGLSRSPRKDRAAEGGRSRNNARSKRTERAVSPSESLVSVTSHVPQGLNNLNPSTSNNPRGSGAANSTNSRGATSNPGGRQRVLSSNNQNRNKAHSNHTPHPADPYAAQRDNVSPPNSIAPTNGSSRRGGGGGGNGASSTSNPRNQYGGASLPAATYARQSVPTSTSQSHVYDVSNGTGHLGQSGAKYDPLAADWTPPSVHQLEGPGMPVPRNNLQVQQQAVDGLHTTGGGGGASSGNKGGGHDSSTADAMDADDVEDERYCYCGGVSYGEMIACDDDTCECEWVRLPPTSPFSLPTLEAETLMLRI